MSGYRPIWIVEWRELHGKGRQLEAYTSRTDARRAFASLKSILETGEILELYRAYPEFGLEAQAAGAQPFGGQRAVVMTPTPQTTAGEA